MQSIKAPIFVIGAGRSGSTVFFENLSCHKDIGWLTNYEARFPRLYCGGALRRLLERKHWYVVGRKPEYVRTPWLNRFLPKRREAYAFWSRCTGEDFHRSWLWSRRASPATALRMQNIIQRILFWQGKERFAAKFTGPGRIAYLRSLFPDARYIHLTREPVALAAAQWRAVVEGVRREAAAQLDPGMYLEIQYEDFVAQPRHTISELWSWLGIREDKRGLGLVENYPLRATRNDSLIGELESGEFETIKNWVFGLFPTKNPWTE